MVFPTEEVNLEESRFKEKTGINHHITSLERKGNFGYKLGMCHIKAIR